MTMSGNSALQDMFEAPGAADLVADGVRLSATALHHGANDWARALRRAGIARGDRVVCALPNGAAFVQLLAATLADGITLAPVPEREDVVPLLGQLDARLAVALHSSHPNVAVPARTGGPPGSPLQPQRALQRTDTLAFLLRSSGTMGSARWIGLSDTGVLAVLSSHLPHLAVEGECVHGILPWHHAFGLVLGLLPALLRARRIVVTAAPARTADAIVGVARAQDVTHLSMVPLTVMRLAAQDDGLALLRRVHGGIVGGAAIDTALVPILAGTRLRVGYGQTEASPGIMLGDPGEFRPFILGRPVGCEVRIEADGVLSFRGPNACAGTWEHGSFHALDPDRWHRTDDRVTIEGGVYVHRGRASLSFKLANGTQVDVATLEHTIREALPQVSEVVLTSGDGRSIDVLHSTADGVSAEAAVRARLGTLQSWVQAVRLVPADRWVRTPKGEIDRQRLPQP
ncbi:MAG: acyl--CoA ligase [Gemmatimonadaceae bacterium]|nr:acyl--CoA ligase [Gemmatimonadaceae bacterium]